MMKRLAHTLAALAATLAVASPPPPRSGLKTLADDCAVPPAHRRRRATSRCDWRSKSDNRWWSSSKPGAGGIVGVSNIARAKPDGYTLGTVNYPTLTIIPHQQAMPYDP